MKSHVAPCMASEVQAYSPWPEGSATFAVTRDFSPRRPYWLQRMHGHLERGYRVAVVGIYASGLIIVRVIGNKGCQHAG